MRMGATARAPQTRSPPHCPSLLVQEVIVTYEGSIDCWNDFLEGASGLGVVNVNPIEKTF